MEVQQAIYRRNQLVGLVHKVMQPGIDFGTVPGTDKPTLLKPGAEKINTFFGFTVRLNIVEKIEDWTGQEHGGEPLFYYWYRAQSWYGDTLVAEADGSCNSREAKYRWRWVPEDDIPPGLDKSTLKRRSAAVSEFTFAVEKAETTGPYGKPAEYWQRFTTAIDQGTAHKVKKLTRAGKEMDAWEIGGYLYRVPNDDIASQVNTVKKMAQKRAYVGVTLPAANASEFFTQDIEDYVEGDFAPAAGPVVSPVPEPPTPSPAPGPAGHSTANGDTPKDKAATPPPAPKVNSGNVYDQLITYRDTNRVNQEKALWALVFAEVGYFENEHHLKQALILPGWPKQRERQAWEELYHQALAYVRSKAAEQPESEIDPPLFDDDSLDYDDNSEGLND